MIIPLDDHKSRLDEEDVEMVIFGVQVHRDGATTLGIMTLGIMTFGPMTFRTRALSITTLKHNET